ncbi:MAG TPA: hypothetical protein VH415_10195 [Nitrososphaeraceae archaeon]|jgi:hypothetical protein
MIQDQVDHIIEPNDIKKLKKVVMRMEQFGGIILGLLVDSVSLSTIMRNCCQVFTDYDLILPMN